MSEDKWPEWQREARAAQAKEQERKKAATAKMEEQAKLRLEARENLLNVGVVKIARELGMFPDWETDWETAGISTPGKGRLKLGGYEFWVEPGERFPEGSFHSMPFDMPNPPDNLIREFRFWAGRRATNGHLLTRHILTLTMQGSQWNGKQDWESRKVRLADALDELDRDVEKARARAEQMSAQAAEAEAGLYVMTQRQIEADAFVTQKQITDWFRQLAGRLARRLGIG